MTRPGTTACRASPADIIRHAPYETSRGRLPAQTTEINGNMLQVLSRLYFKTGEKAYLDQVLAIADFYFLDMLPTTNDLPADRWDVKTQKPLNTRFVLSDHGNEIVGGLSEAFVLAMHARPDKAAQYRPAFIRMIDRLLAVGRTADGVWHHDIDIVTGKPIAGRHAHCWGYMFNGVYTAYMATGEPRFREAVERALATVTRTPTYLFDETPPVTGGAPTPTPMPSNRRWCCSTACPTPGLPGADRHRHREDARRRPPRRHRRGLARRRQHHSHRAHVRRCGRRRAPASSPGTPRCTSAPQRDGSSVLLSVTADRAWTGRVHFDYPRHRDHLHLPINYPRLNEWPEWFTVEHDRRYEVRIGDAAPAATTRRRTGAGSADVVARR